MAVRFTASSQRYTTTTNLPGSVFTITNWVYISVDRDAFSAFWTMGGTSPNPRAELTTDADGTTITLVDSVVNFVGSFASSVGTWYRVAVVVNGANATLYHGAATGALSSASTSAFAPASSPALFTLGCEANGTFSFINGRIAAFKMWDTTLSQLELEAELAQYAPVRTTNLLRFHPLINTETVDYSGNAYSLSGGTGSATEDGPPLLWGPPAQPRVMLTPRMPTVDAGKNIFGTAGFEFAIQAVETGAGITARSWTVVSGPAEVATEIGTTSLLSWFPATAGVYELEYRVTNPAGQGYDTVYATVNSTGTIVNSASVSGTGTTLTCNKPTSTAEGDVMLAVQSGDFNDFDLMTSPNDWQPLFEYDVGLDNLHTKGWTLTAGASEPASYNFTQGTGSAGTVTIVAMRGVVEGGVRREIVADTGTTATRTCPTVEGAVDGSILLCGAMTDPGAARTWTPPSGMTEQADVQSGTATTHSVASLLDPPDPTGAKSFTLSGTTVAPGGIQWSAVFPMPPDPQRRGANKSMFTVVKTR